MRATATGALVVALAMLLAGCVTTQQKRDAVNAVNKEFQRRYEQILAIEGTRVFDIERGKALNAMATTLIRLDMQVETLDAGLGYLKFYAPAPKPLSAEEWRRAVQEDLPLMREIVRPYVGLAAEFLQFEPDAFETVISVTMVQRGTGTAVSLTMRLREVKPAGPADFPRREYPPPTALRLGIVKIWSAFERELYSPSRRP